MEEMAQVRAGTVQQNSEKVYAASWCAARFHCLVEEWHECEKLNPTDLCGLQRERVRSIARSGCVAQLEDEDAREVRGLEVDGNGIQTQVEKV